MNPGPDAAPLYASVDGVAYPLGRDECVFQVRGAPLTHVMTAEVLSALDETRAFRTLAEHGDAIAARIPALAGKLDAIQRVLQHLVKRGLLRSGDDYLRADGGADARPAPFAGAFIRAGDGAAGLERLLGSVRLVPGFEPGSHRWFVVDHARDAATTRAQRGASAAFSQASRSRVEYIDGSRRARIVQRLAKAVPEAAAALERALGQGSSGGAAAGADANLVLLLGAGRRLALLDDTMVLPLRGDVRPGRDLALGDGAGLETRFHRDVEAALATGEAQAGDPFAQALAWCGHRVGTLLGPEGAFVLDRAELRGFEPSRHPRLTAASHVLATFNGERGDAIDTRTLFLLEGEGRDAFAEDRAGYLARLERACVSRAPRQPTVTPYGSSQPFVLDDSRLPAPAVPGASDPWTLVGVLGHALRPDGVALHGDTTIGRTSPTRPPRALLFAPETPSFSQYLADWLGAQADRLRGELPEQRMHVLAVLIDDLADAPGSLQLELLHEYLRFRRSELIDRLQRSFVGFKAAPVHWQADVRELISVNGRALTEASPPRLAGWPEALDESGCVERLARELRSYAELLRHWPALWRAASESGDGLLTD